MCEIMTALAIGTAISSASQVVGGFAQNAAAKAEAAQIDEQRAQEAALNNVKDNRLRSQFADEIARQRLGLAGAGVSLDSPSALALGRRAAGELSFESQSVRSSGQATDRELSFAAQSARYRGRVAATTGVFNAGTNLLMSAPKIFPGLDG